MPKQSPPRCGTTGCTAEHENEPGKNLGAFSTKWTHIIAGDKYREDFEGDYDGPYDSMICPHKIQNGTMGIVVVQGGARLFTSKSVLQAAKRLQKYNSFMDNRTKA